MTVPRVVRDSVRQHLWEIADRNSWETLPIPSKSTYYESWAKDPRIGGLLERFIDRRRVRTYLKDTIMKAYGRARMADDSLPLRVLNIGREITVEEAFDKPHGRRLSDGRIICWGRADEWKNILMAVHERSHLTSGCPYAAVLIGATGRFQQVDVRSTIEDAADKLGIRQLVWLEG